VKTNTYLLSLCICLLFHYSTSAQDVHFSQYYNAPLQINPALTGIYNGDFRFMANYRDQWSSVPVDYRTYAAAFDMKYFHKKMENAFFGGGILLLSDKAGDSELGLTQVVLSTSYSQLINENNIMSAGFQLGVGQRAFNTEHLQLGNQFNGDLFLATESSGENFTNTSAGYMDINAGLNWHVQFDEGLKRLDIGIGAFHLNQPQQKFYDSDDVALPVRWSAYSSGEVKLSELWDGVFHGMFQQQGAYNEALSGFGAKYWLNRSRGQEMAIQLGTTYRFIGRSDALIPYFELYYLAWKMGLSYDINMSDFDIATNNRGGLELSLMYIIKRVEMPKEIKSCPVF
jgi:type IX secretion system PorP/SprF family membrane protein